MHSRLETRNFSSRVVKYFTLSLPSLVFFQHLKTNFTTLLGQVIFAM